ncbi:hypothetical protein COOONC_26622 [Cooperia oncophora]
MLFVLAALCLVMESVGADTWCLSYLPLNKVYREFHRTNPNLEWNNELAQFACDELKRREEHPAKYKLLAKMEFSGKPNPFTVRRTLFRGTTSTQREDVTIHKPGTKYGCDAWNEGNTMKVLCLYN